MDALGVSAKRRRAEAVAESLVAASVGIEAVLLFGSVARGDAGVESDIDLMAISKSPLRLGALREVVSDESVSLVCHTWESMRRAREEDWSFFVHLREEGEVLYGVEGPLRRELEAVRVAPPAARWDDLVDELHCLERYDDLGRFSAGYVFPLARIFRVARYTCMLDNTAEGHIAFRREDAFDLFASRRPDMDGDVSRVCALWPFQARTQGRRLEFPHSGEDPERVTEAVHSAKRVVRAALDAAASR